MKTGRVMLGETDPVSLILGLADNFFLFYFSKSHLELTCHTNISYNICTSLTSFFKYILFKIIYSSFSNQYFLAKQRPKAVA